MPPDSPRTRAADRTGRAGAPFYRLCEPAPGLTEAEAAGLEAALEAFPGTLLLVSHDRRFLAALTNRVLELTPGSAHLYGGGYLEYVAASGHEAPGMRS